MVQFERRYLKADQINMVDKTATTQKIDIPRDKFIKAIILHQHGGLTYAASQPDLGDTQAVVPSLIGDVRLIRDGGQQIVSADWDLLAKMDYVEKAGMPGNNMPGAEATAIDWDSFIYLDFAVDPNDPEEAILEDDDGELMTLMLPAMNYSSLKLEVDIDASLLATTLAGLFGGQIINDGAAGGTPTFTVGTGILDITLIEAFLEDDDPELTEDDVFEQRQTTITKYLQTSQDDFPIDLTVGVLYRRLAMQIRDNAVPTQSRVTEYKVKQMSPVRWEILHELLRTSQVEDMNEYHLPKSMEAEADIMNNSTLVTVSGIAFERFMGIARGFTIVDFDNGRSLDGSKDFTDLKSGDIQLQLKTDASVDATQDTVEILEQYVV